MTTHPIEPRDAEDIATKVARLVRDHYVFPAEATRLHTLIAARISAGNYARTGDLETLAETLTADLQSVNGDRHLRVLYSDLPVVDLDDADAELAMWASRADGDAGGIGRLEILPHNIGLVELRPILYPAVLVADRIAAAFTLVAGAEALILDVRKCLGGSPDTVALVCSYLFDDTPVHLNSMVDRAGRVSEQSWTLAEVPGWRFGAEKRLVVLTSATTFSGAEELAYDLQQLGRATIVGERTGGGANPREGYRVHDHLEATIPVARPVNPTSGTNWELVGVVPDIPVDSKDALETAVRLIVG